MRITIHVQHYSYINKCISVIKRIEWSKAYGLFRVCPPSKQFQVSITEWLPNRMQDFYVSVLQSHDHSSCCPDWTMWMPPSNHSQALWWLRVLLILLSNAMSWFVGRLLFVYGFSTFHTMARVLVCSQSYHQVSQFGCLHAKFSPELIVEYFSIKFFHIRMFKLQL